ncbi:MAG: arginine repressor, partial [Clostridia bacterium]
LSDRFNRIFAETVLSIVDAYNLIVVKTLAGSAHVAGEAVDNLHWPEIVGTLAGDNTIVVIVKRIEDVPALMERFRSMVHRS